MAKSNYHGSIEFEKRNIRLPKEHYDRLRELARGRFTTYTQLVREAVAEYLSKHSNNK